MLFSRHFPKLYKSPHPPSLASWYSLSPNSHQTSNIIAQEKLSTQADRNGWSNRFAHVVRRIRGIGDDIDEGEALRIEQTYPWPPTEKDTVTSLVNFSVSAEAWWKGEPPNVDSLALARNIVAIGLDTETPACICHEHIPWLVSCSATDAFD
jgi:hypothetical protein